MISSVSNGSLLSPTQGQQRAHRGGRGNRPELPDSFKSIVDSAIKDGGSRDDIQKDIASKYADYQKTDAYAALSTDQKTQLNELVENGPPQGGSRGAPRAIDANAANALSATDTAAATNPSQVAKQLLDVLAQRGEAARDKLNTSFAAQSGAASLLEE